MTDMPFADSDDLLQSLYNNENGTGLSVREIFRLLGETEFRKLEIRALRELFSGNSRKIIALGGGVLSNPFLTDADRNAFGFLCCLDVNDALAYERIQANGLPPFLQEKADPFASFCEMNRSRREIFRKQADFIVVIGDGTDTTPEITAGKILAAYKEKLK